MVILAILRRISTKSILGTTLSRNLSYIWIFRNITRLYRALIYLLRKKQTHNTTTRIAASFWHSFTPTTNRVGTNLWPKGHVNTLNNTRSSLFYWTQPTNQNAKKPLSRTEDTVDKITKIPGGPKPVYQYIIYNTFIISKIDAHSYVQLGHAGTFFLRRFPRAALGVFLWVGGSSSCHCRAISTASRSHKYKQ